jgi:DNA-binding transcriptional LysR family regulator
MILDDFDMIVSLVALGLGVALVPRRTLALTARRHAVQRIPVDRPFCRDVVLAVRRSARMPQAVTSFLDNVLF